jgi:phosphatidylserine synthase
MNAGAWLSLVRSLPGIAALIFSTWGDPLVAGSCLVGAVWADAIGGWCARRADWRLTSFGTQVENLADCFCFVAAPAAFVACICRHREVAAPIAVFVLAGIFRLARFQVEGLVRGGYRGLPVTYNGYIFPAAGLIFFHWPAWNSLLVWSMLLMAVSALMVSTFVVPEI